MRTDLQFVSISMWQNIYSKIHACSDTQKGERNLPASYSFILPPHRQIDYPAGFLFCIWSHSQTLHKYTKETIYQISFSGFSRSLVLGARQLQINRVHSSPADLWTNTWAHTPATLNSLPTTSFDQQKPISICLILALDISHSLSLFPPLFFCMKSICFFFFYL